MKLLRMRPEGAVRLVGDTYYVPGLTNSGFVDGLVIDTVPDETVYDGLTCDALTITHGHTDHFSAGPRLREGGATVWASRDDAHLIENPEVNIRGMFSWAKPGDVLVTKLFLGEACEVDGLLDDWRDERAITVSLPGHTLGHTGMLTADGVLFSGDALYQERIWERHRLPYAIDPSLVSQSLEHIATLDFEYLVPGHGDAIGYEDALRHIQYHLERVHAIEAFLLEQLVTPRTTEQAVALVSERRELPSNPATYWLAVTTVKGFLGNLQSRGLIEFEVRDYAGWWHTAAEAQDAPER